MRDLLAERMVTGEELGDQLVIGPKELDASKFLPVEMGTRGYWAPKPQKGGLWTSTFHAEYGSGWIQWCMSEEFGVERTGVVPDCWRLTPEPDARVYRIHTYEDLRVLVEAFPAVNQHTRVLGDAYPHWERVAEHFDAVHLTDEGQWATRLSIPLNLYGWDCESTLWLQWAFIQWEPLGTMTFKPLPDSYWLEEDNEAAVSAAEGEGE